MKNMISSLLKMVVVAGMALFSVQASAQTVVSNVAISKIRTGWASDQFALETKGTPIANPAGCQVADGYATDSTQSGYKTFLMMATMAMATEKTVTIILSNSECNTNRPKIWGIYVDAQ